MPDDAPEITATVALAYPEPDIKRVPLARLPMGARSVVLDRTEGFCRTRFGHVPAAHFAPSDADPVGQAERLLGVPYLWGGRSSLGLDCSALVQVMMRAAGLPCPRDSDLQEALGRPATAPARRGDLVFWAGHVGIMQDEARLLHANAHHMCVASEPLAEAQRRIAATPAGDIRARRRVL